MRRIVVIVFGSMCLIGSVALFACAGGTGSGDPACGDGLVDIFEMCDDGNTVGGDGCSADCRSNESCGNGIVDVTVGEACDDGNNVDGDGCSATCALPFCGDGVVDAVTGEACDDGNNVDGDGCNATCTSNESCGNGIVDVGVGESCDDGNTVSGDGCSDQCEDEQCGNGVTDSGEVCDDGNVVSGDGCSSDCQSDETCGNGIVDTAAGETCDDGDVVSGDGCSSICGLEYCGNTVVDASEVCDDGNNTSGDGCSGDCQSNETCGNGYVDVIVGEACDDGNLIGGDGCSATCAAEVCGNFILDVGEQCDDGNLIPGDGCDENCALEAPIGSYALDDAPFWTTDPPTYTCLEACALVFGGVDTDYRCSISSSTITDTAWYSGYADSQYCEPGGNPRPADWKVGTNYDCGVFACSYSAYVDDNCNSGTSINYCWSS